MSFFSLYVDPFEKEVDKFLKRVNRKSKEDLRRLMQEDLVQLTVFLEYKFKAYKKLKKGYRRTLYENAGLIAKDFVIFFDERKGEIMQRQKTLDVPESLKHDAHFTYLLGIMEYLKIGQRLKYQEAATFEKLLKNPKSTMLIGDCNQIATLYIYLYSLHFPIEELRVKILPEHICLHYRGVDIETTNATLVQYHDYIYLSDVEEIVASNVLDIADPLESKFDISPSNMLKAAQLAFHFSSHRATVDKNLFIAYHNMAVYYAGKNNFLKAKLYANKSGNTKLQRDVTRMEGVRQLKAKHYKRAAEIFRQAGDTEGEKVCAQNELADLFDSTKTLKTVADYKGKKAELRRMKELAIRINNQKVVDFVNDVLKKLSK